MNNKLTSLSGGPITTDLFDCKWNPLSEIDIIPYGAYKVKEFNCQGCYTIINGQKEIIKLEKPEWVICEKFIN